MKTWAEYEGWLRRQNAKVFAAEKIQLTPAALMKRLEAAWSAGRRAGEEQARSEKSIFEQVFGKR